MFYTYNLVYMDAHVFIYIIIHYSFNFSRPHSDDIIYPFKVLRCIHKVHNVIPRHLGTIPRLTTQFTLRLIADILGSRQPSSLLNKPSVHSKIHVLRLQQLGVAGHAAVPEAHVPAGSGQCNGHEEAPATTNAKRDSQHRLTSADRNGCGYERLGSIYPTQAQWTNDSMWTPQTSARREGVAYVRDEHVCRDGRVCVRNSGMGVCAVHDAGNERVCSTRCRE